MAYGTVNADVIGTSVANTSLGAGNASIMKNRIINGAMVIDQRNAGASITPSGFSTYSVDRWNPQTTQSSKYTIQQNAGSVTPPVGFTNYLGVTSSSAYSVLTGDFFFVTQAIEGYNIADLGWGTANAKTVTLSFQVYSSLTGSFGGVLYNSAGTQSYPFLYSVSSANTWTSISVTIPGSTTGTWLTTNGTGMNIVFSLGAGASVSGTAGAWAGSLYRSATGATSVVGTNGATFYITGVQLEVGSSATGFEYRQYQQELALCQRYFIYYGGGSYTSLGSGLSITGTAASVTVAFPVAMRSAPAVSYSGTLIITDRASYDLSVTSISASNSSTVSSYVNVQNNTGATTFRPCFLTVSNGGTGALLLSSEL